MSITIDNVSQSSPPVAAGEYWQLAASDGNRVVALLNSGGSAAAQMATFSTAAPWVWAVHTTPFAFSPSYTVVVGDTILGAGTGGAYRFSTDAGATWSAAASWVTSPASAPTLVGTTVVVLHVNESISTADISDLSSWSNSATDLPDALWVPIVFFGGAYYAAGSVFDGVGFLARVFRSTNLTSWTLVHAGAEGLDSSGAVLTPTHLMYPRNNGTALTTSNGLDWTDVEVDWAGTVGSGVTTDDGIAVIKAGSQLQATADGAEWTILNAGFPIGADLVMFDGDVLAGRNLAGSRQMGSSEITYTPPPPASFWWNTRINVDVEPLE